MLDLKEGLTGFVRKLLEMPPDHHGTADDPQERRAVARVGPRAVRHATAQG
jgi:hypothetical protein